MKQWEQCKMNGIHCHRIALRLFLSTNTTLLRATGFQSYYTAPTGLLLASVFGLPSCVTISYHTAYSSTLKMEAAGSSKMLVSMKLHGNTYKRTVIFIVTYYLFIQ
jgi:hypothetical protein